MVLPIQSAGSGGGGTLAGDVTGPAGSNLVSNIQGNPVDLTGIASGDFLVFNGSVIVPVAGAPSALPSGYEAASYVDPIRGNDTTGQRGNDQLPFATLAGAVSAPSTVAGDLIAVGPYTMNLTACAPAVPLSIAGQGPGTTAITAPGGTTTIDASDALIVQDMTVNSGGKEAIASSAAGPVALRNLRVERFGSPGPALSFSGCASVTQNGVEVANGQAEYTDVASIRIINSRMPGNGKTTIAVPTVNTIAEVMGSQLGDVEWQGSSPSAFLVGEGSEVGGFNGAASSFGAIQAFNATFRGNVVTGADYNVTMQGCVIDGDLVIGNCTGPITQACRNGAVTGSITVGANVTLDLRGTKFNQANLTLDPTAAVILDNNYIATTNPGVSDDESQGWQVGSQWINTTTSTAFVCVDNSVGAAIWKSAPAFEATNQARVDPTYGNDATGDLDDLTAPYQTLQAAEIAAAGAPSPYSILLTGSVTESVAVTAASLTFQGTARSQSVWQSATTECATVPSGGTLRFDTMTLDGAAGACVVAPTGGAISAESCDFLSGSSIAFNLNIAELSARDCRIAGVQSQDGALHLFEQCNGVGDLRITSATAPSDVVLNDVNWQGSLIVDGSVAVNVSKGSFVNIVDASAWSDILGPRGFNFYGVASDLSIFAVANSTISLQGATILNGLTFTGYSGTLGLFVQDANVGTLTFANSAIGPIAIDAQNITVRGTITIGNDVTVDLSGANYDPNGIVLNGTGRYIDTRNARTRSVPAAVVGASYNVQPRDGVIPCDNFANDVNVYLPLASESCGTIVVAALSDPPLSGFKVVVNATGGDTIDGLAVYDMDASSKRRLTLVCDPGGNGWIIADVYPGPAAAPLPFPDEPGITYTLTTAVGGVVMTNTAARQVTLPTTPPDGTSFVVVDGAGTAGTANIEVIPPLEPILGVVGSDFISSNYAAVTYKFSASVGAWSRA